MMVGPLGLILVLLFLIFIGWGIKEISDNWRKK